MGIFSDGRFDANLLTFYGAMVFVVLVTLGLRRLLDYAGRHCTRGTGIKWLDSMSDEAIGHARRLLGWLTGSIILTLLLCGIGYHLAGRDIRTDVGQWYTSLTGDDFLRLGSKITVLGGLLFGSGGAVWLLRRARPYLETSAARWLERPDNEDTLQTWFSLLERYGVAAIRLWALWMAGKVVGLEDFSDCTFGFTLCVLSILVIARLLTLAFRVLSRSCMDLGDRRLGTGQFRHYWERISRLLPFGERCFEAAVYISAASLCVRELRFIAFVADFGPRIVECIGILFTTRVLIELIQVLLNEAFGLYDEDRPMDSKGRTLVPLVQSVCQYGLYFGSVVIMLGVVGIDTRPLLAGAGILGLAVGLGAQNLVTDVVSGFFILFENQYLVGDYVQIGDATGTVEAVSIRCTQIRDNYGKLHIIPNGQVKGVVSYSKGHVNAVVDIRVPAGSDLESTFRSMTEAGRRLRQGRKEVLADTVIQGLVELGSAEMTVRAVTRVKPGTHTIMQNEYRRLLKQVFDEARQAEAATSLAA